MTGILLLEGLAIAVVSAVAGAAVGLAAGSFDLGFGTYVGVGLIGNVLWAPWLPAVFAVAYREKTHGDKPSGVRAPGGDAAIG
jgi:hypothetical protein